MARIQMKCEVTNSNFKQKMPCTLWRLYKWHNIFIILCTKIELSTRIPMMRSKGINSSRHLSLLMVKFEGCGLRILAVVESSSHHCVNDF